MNILLVDDKYDVVQGIREGVSWELLGDIKLYEAYSGQEALKVLEKEKIDLLITDIEMPGMSGIELAEKVSQKSRNTGIVFLSSHDSFRYAQAAIRFGCYDYILQPVDYNTLRLSIERVIHMMREKHKGEAADEERGNKTDESAYDAGRIDKNRAWRRVIVSSPAYTEEMIAETLERVGIEPDFGGLYRLVLLRLYWKKGSLGGWKDNELEDRFVKNMEEMLRRDLPLVRLIPMYDNEWILLFEETDLTAYIQNLIGKGENNRNYRLAAYVASACRLTGLHSAYQTVLAMKENNISGYGGIYEYEKNRHPGSERLNPSTELSVHRWKGLLLEGKEKEIEAEISRFLTAKEEKKQISRTLLALLLQMLTDTFYNSAEEQMKELMTGNTFSEAYIQATESPEFLLKYLSLLNDAYEKIRESRDEDLGQSLVRKIRNYIDMHLGNRLSRTEISEEFYISRDYISHLFTKYENVNFTQYVNDRRMEKARELLAKTSLPVNVIASSVGFSEYSYFSKMFRDYTGMSANEYRSGFRKNQ